MQDDGSSVLASWFSARDACAMRAMRVLLGQNGVLQPLGFFGLHASVSLYEFLDEHNWHLQNRGTFLGNDQSHISSHGDQQIAHGVYEDSACNEDFRGATSQLSGTTKLGYGSSASCPMS
eukprot:1712185-Amphidinium_carterae.1